MTGRGLLAVAAILLAGRAASAQPRRVDDGFDAALAEGRRLYEIREWDQAIAKFKAAYAIREDPRALFNIAQAYRLKGDCVAALGVYKTFKRKFPDNENNERVEKFIAAMEACAQPAQSGEAAATEPPAAPEPSRVDVVEAPTAAAGRPSRVPTYLMIGGLALAAGGLASHLFLLQPVRDDLAAAASAHDEPEYRRLESRFDTRRTLTIGLYAAGGLAIATGFILRYTVFKRAETPAQLSIAPQPGGAVVSWSSPL